MSRQRRSGYAAMPVEAGDAADPSSPGGHGGERPPWGRWARVGVLCVACGVLGFALDRIPVRHHLGVPCDMDQLRAELNALGDCSELPRGCPGTNITSVYPVPAGTFVPPGRAEVLPTPRFCRVEAVTEPAIRFEVWLPLDWNMKLHVAGNGGMAGTISYSAMAKALARGYSCASTDTGHTASPGSSFDASWALGRPDLVADFGHRSLHLTTVHAKRIVQAFFGLAAAQSYYQGCSKGGQQGLMEAQRYPEDFDGLVVGDPAHAWTRFYTGAHLWYSQHDCRAVDRNRHRVNHCALHVVQVLPRDAEAQRQLDPTKQGGAPRRRRQRRL